MGDAADTVDMIGLVLYCGGLDLVGMDEEAQFVLERSLATGYVRMLH